MGYRRGLSPLDGRVDRIDWTDPNTIPDLAGNTAGLGGGQVVTAPDDRRTYVTATITLDVPQVTDGLASFATAGDPGGPATARALVMHELGHVLGLAHIDDPHQLMHATSPVRELGDGDRRGLAILGQGGCEPRL